MTKKKVMMLLCSMSICVGLLAGCQAKPTQDPVETEQVTQEAVEVQPSEDVEVAEEETPAENEEQETVEENTDGNMIANGDFSEGIGTWMTYLNGGDGSIGVNDQGQMEIDVQRCGDLDYSVQAYYDGFALDKGGVYHFAFDMAVDTPRTVVWRMQINGGDYHEYFTDSIQATTELTHYEYDLTMEQDSDPAPRLCFNVGKYDGDGDLGAHKIAIDNLELRLTDDSNVVKGEANEDTTQIRLNQVGYQPQDFKKAVFTSDSIGNEFEVVKAGSGESVFKGQITDKKMNENSGENTGVGDFSQVTTPGTYQIISEGLADSYEFTISDDAYADLLKSLTYMVEMQKCGELPGTAGGEFAHPACHNTKATVYGTSEKIDVSGGWHDAGDYGRYVVSGAKAAADLLIAYEEYPQAFGMDQTAPDSIPVLSLTKYELDWMLKMQRADGGVYHKVTCANFPGTVMPQDETEELIVSPVSNAATGDFAAVMAMAARLYKDDSGYANTCLEAAKKAYSYLQEHKRERGFKNPDDIVTGEYPDMNCQDEIVWSAAELFKTTGDASYEADLQEEMSKANLKGFGWAAVGGYGCYSYMTNEKANPQIKDALMAKWNEALDEAVNAANNDAYDCSITGEYPWGSNMTVANNGMMFALASKLDGVKGTEKEKQYLQLADAQLSYLLGNNATGYCFVTGYGSKSPEHTHHRPSQALGKTMPGMLVGGPDSNLEDPYATAVLKDKPRAKCYVDNDQSYSCNEITIYWNSPMVALLASIISK